MGRCGTAANSKEWRIYSLPSTSAEGNSRSPPADTQKQFAAAVRGIPCRDKGRYDSHLREPGFFVAELQGLKALVLCGRSVLARK